MGNSNEKQGTNTKAYGDGNSFHGEEVKTVEVVFVESSVTSAEKAQRALNQELVVKHFPENPEFSKKLFKWFEKVSNTQNVVFKDFIAAIEVLAKDPVQYQNQFFRTRSFEKYEILLQISTENYLGDKESLSSTSVTYAQALQFVKEVLNAFHSQKSPKENVIEFAAKVIISNFFRDPEATISWRDMLYNIKQNLIYINKAIKLYFSGKFVERALPLKLPTIDDETNILNKELLGIFYLSNSFFHSVPKLSLLYSTSKSGTSFNRLAYALKGYEAPTLLLIKHVEKGDESRGVERSSYIFGGFSRAGWYDELKYNGDSEGYIFSLAPKFKSFYAHRGQGGTNYMYLNTKRIQNSKYKVGLGFGGYSNKSYRLWLDEELETESYVGPEDDTYEKGYLVDPSITKFNIEQVEIWGLGDESALHGQVEFRNREMELIESQRKVDKKAFLGSFDKEMFLGKTFKTDQRADQTDFRAEMEKIEEDKLKAKNQ